MKYITYVIRIMHCVYKLQDFIYLFNIRRENTLLILRQYYVDGSNAIGVKGRGEVGASFGRGY